MRPDSRRKPAVDGPGPLRLASPPPPDVGPISPPEDPRPEAPTPGIEPLLSIGDFCRTHRCDRRTIERLRSAGHLPRPDISISRCPRWRTETIRRWIEGEAAHDDLR